MKHEELSSERIRGQRERLKPRSVPRLADSRTEIIFKKNHKLITHITNAQRVKIHYRIREMMPRQMREKTIIVRKNGLYLCLCVSVRVERF